ncbi:4290_t:CDS:2, partial [Dentiscutata heterogama]
MFIPKNQPVENQDIISKIPKEQDTNTKEQVKETNTYLTSTEYSQKSLNQPTIKDHDGISLMLDQKITPDLDITSKESEQRSQIHSKVLVCNSSDKQDISKKQIKYKPESKRFHDHSKDLKDLERFKPQKDHKRRLNALRKS